jgi:hypothetical protein
MRSVLFALEMVWVFLTTIFRKTHTANICGHKTKRMGFVKGHERDSILTMPLAENGRPDYCLDCIGKMAIKCAWCSCPISIGEPVTLYTPRDTFEVPDHAVPYTEGGSNALVGCLRWGCAMGGADRAGFWLPGEDGKGRVRRVPTAIEILMGNPDAKALIVHNTHDAVEAMNPTIISK